MALICPRHRYRLRETSRIIKCTYPRKMISPVYLCPLCSNKYVNFEHIRDNKLIVVGNNRFINVLRRRTNPATIKEYKIPSASQAKEKTQESNKINNEVAVLKTQAANKSSREGCINTASHIQSEKTIVSIKKADQNFTEKRCYVYGVPKATKCMLCGFGLKKEKTVSQVNGKIKVCLICGSIHMPYKTYLNNPTWKPINEKDIPAIVNNLNNKEERKKQEKSLRKKVDVKTGGGKKISEKDLLMMKKDKELKERLSGVFQTVHYGSQTDYTGAYNRQYMHSKNDEMVYSRSSKMRNIKSVSTSTITAKDFVVRRNIFRCRYNNHSLQDVQAVFTTISRMGNVNKITIPAGYCPSCNMYFIMDSTYKTIKNSGVPICKTMDDKTYTSMLENQLSGRWSQESILMQFGYSVSQVDDLPRVQRQKILAAIVDNRVLSKSDVISYLNNFIDLRKNQKNSDGSQKYRVAIMRWTEDRTFITHYKTGTFEEVQIRRIVTDK